MSIAKVLSNYIDFSLKIVFVWIVTRVAGIICMILVTDVI